MALELSTEIGKLLPQLRFEPAPRRVRAAAGSRIVVDSDRAVLVWEAGRLTPVYAVPREDIAADLLPCPAGPDTAEHGFRLAAGGPVLTDPRTGFRRHSGPGQEFTLLVDGTELPGAAFRSADPDLDGYLLLDFAAFGQWREEEQVIEGHPRDPFHRVDARVSSRRVRVEFDGVLLADTAAPVFVFEAMLPVRTYIQRTDVDWTHLVPGDHTSICPYKGRASYWSVATGGPRGRNLAWSYEQTLPDSGQLQDLVAFYDEHVDVFLDGTPRRPGLTPWS